MTKKESSQIEIIVKMVADSIQAKTLEKDYPAIAGLCRQAKISTYVLHLIIDRELNKQPATPLLRSSSCFDVDTRCLRKMAEYNEFLEWKRNRKDETQKEEKKPTRWQRFFNLFKKVLRICFWLVGVMVGVGAAYIAYAKYAELVETRKKLNTANYTISTIRRIAEESDISFGDWESRNHEHSSVSDTTYTFQASVGDYLTLHCDVDCESGYDKLALTIHTLSSGSPRTIATISGEDKHKDISYVFSEDGTYTLRTRYSKDSSIHKGKDSARVSRIRLLRNNTAEISEIFK